MIRRILELELQSFRSIWKKQTISFDADAVILYGPNGTGKSCLLAAVEFGLTGVASDLAKFPDDYPRCLTNIRSNEPGKVAVKFVTAQGIHRAEAEAGGSREHSSLLSEQERTSYSEHCFLSQAKLHRLIESYLTMDEGGAEQRLIRFGRELLGLDLLENLATGLFDVADIRRIRNSSQPYHELLTSKERSDEEVHRLERLLEARNVTFQSALEALHHLLANPESTASSIREADILQLYERVEGSAQQKFIDQTAALDRLRRLYARFQNAAILLEVSTGDHDPDNLGRLQRRIEALKAQQDVLVLELQFALDGVGRDLVVDDLRIFNQSVGSDLSDKIEQLEKILKLRLNTTKGELQSMAETDNSRREIEGQMAQITSELAQAAESTSETVKEQRQWVEVLRTIVSRIHGNECPVCKRDYSELQLGSLREKIVSDADQISRRLRSAEQELSSRALLQADQRSLGKRLETLSSQIERQASRRQELDQVITKYESRLARILTLSETKALWRNITTEIRQAESHLLENDARLKQRTHALSDVGTIATAAGIQEVPVPLSFENVRPIGQVLSNLINVLQQEQEKSRKLQESAFLVRTLSAELQELRSSLQIEQTRQAQLATGCNSVDVIIQRARVLRLSAVETKSELLNQAFTGTLNRLWREFFDRLARAERFHPEMSEPVLVRNLIRTSVQGSAPNIEPFSHIGSVLSSGNLNTAALSLFLALHVMDHSSHSVLVLDDPIQSVDDVHVSQLAILLRALMTQVGRQIVVAVHDRSLFDYLALEFAPTEEGRSLMTLELQRTGPESDVVVVHRKTTWEPSFRFGT